MAALDQLVLVLKPRVKALELGVIPQYVGFLSDLDAADHAVLRQEHVADLPKEITRLRSGSSAALQSPRQRLETRGLEREDTIHTSPLTLRLGDSRVAVLFRYGVAVFVGLSPIEEDEIVRSLGPRISEKLAVPETESVQIVIRPGGEDQVDPSAPSSSARAGSDVAVLMVVMVAASHPRRHRADFATICATPNDLEKFARRL